ncbi:MAG: hypothetical protein FJ087_11225, partial [Deltaproteobacteria bacterium]|nr:hypothetical protein [Deltaproteobacteria bacterium]
MRLGVLACVPLAALLSCGGGGAGPSPGQDIATGDAASTDGEAVGSDPSAPGDPTTEASADPAADGVADLDADAEATQPGAPWTECEANEDCLSGFCLWHLGRKVCTQACMESESCPKGWTCGQVLNTAGDVFYVCVSRFFSLCRPCTAASDCAGAAGEAGECVRYLRPGAGSTDFFCGATCATEADCPTGYECLQEVGISGKASWQCVSATRECVCTEGYSTLLLASHCTRTNGWGTCEGTRRCEDGALTGCSAAEPAPETCDGVDEDCDGVPDDGLPGCCECGNGKPEDYCGAQKNPLVCPEDYLQ